MAAGALGEVMMVRDMEFPLTIAMLSGLAAILAATLGESAREGRGRGARYDVIHSTSRQSGGALGIRS